MTCIQFLHNSICPAEFLECVGRCALLAYGWAEESISASSMEFNDAYQTAAKQLWVTIDASPSSATSTCGLAPTDSMFMPAAAAAGGRAGCEDAEHGERLAELEAQSRGFHTEEGMQGPASSSGRGQQPVGMLADVILPMRVCALSGRCNQGLAAVPGLVLWHVVKRSVVRAAS